MISDFSLLKIVQLINEEKVRDVEYHQFGTPNRLILGFFRISGN